MGNVTAKQLRPRLESAHAHAQRQSGGGYLQQEVRKSSSASSETSSQDDFLDAESDFQSTTEEERDLEELFSRTHDELLSRSHEDAFMKAVLAFCAHMGARMDALDNARLYDEFCSYAASHTPNVGVV